MTFQLANMFYLEMFIQKKRIKFSDEIQRFIFKGKLITAMTLSITLRKKCPYSELFWSTFSRIRTRIELR